MVLKVSISLPGAKLITFETSEPEVYREVISLALRELPKDLMQIGVVDTIPPGTVENGENVMVMPSRQEEPSRPEIEQDYLTTMGHLANSAEAQESFARFCQGHSPLGDMRRVVVAAEGAGMYFAMEGVSERELGRLFELAGWRRPREFLQALRNAARSKFRWMERVPGSQGYYAVTDAGRANVIGAS